MVEEQRIPADVIEQFIQDVFVGLGVPEGEARISAQVLITSDLRGIDSHGVGRLKYYYDRIISGRHQTETAIELVKETETTALVDGHHGMGHVISYRCMQMAIEKARKHGLGAVAVRNGTHFGIAGFYSLMAAEAGMIGLTVTNARPSIAPTFGTEPMLGTNPVAFAAPTDLPYPFCLDMATSICQRGKVEVAERAGKPVPEGWVIDPQGEPLTDASDILGRLGEARAALLPLGGAGEEFAGYKGYGLAVMVEILSAALSGGAYLKDLSGFGPDGAPRPHMLGHFFLAIDVAHFLPLDEFRRIAGAMLRTLHASRKVPGADRIYVAGEKEFEIEQQRRAEGIPVNANLKTELQLMRDALGIEGYEEYF
ncbi:MAG TPA: Ldh family oxidoreductase [Anaerolineae bacterium]|nr:Ldh family oxidoreductase [Anaerolineae bacterium]